MKKFLKIFFIIGLSLSANGLAAQNPDAVINRNEILIGEQAIITLSYAINKENPAQVVFPNIGDTLLKNVEVVKTSTIDTLTTGEGVSTMRLEQKVHITSFDTGYYAIRPFEFKVNGKIQTTPAFLLTVQTIEVDTTGGIMADRDIYTVNVSFLDYVKVYGKYAAMGLGIIAAILVIVYLIHRYIKNKKKLPPLPPPVPARPAHEVAIERLLQIKEEQIFKRGKVKEYHTLITDTLRLYLQGEFNIPATELTTGQTLQALRYSGLSEKDRSNLRTLLYRADLVKFAKEIPDDIQNLAAVDDAITFVENTKPIAETPPTNEPQKPEQINA